MAFKLLPIGIDDFEEIISLSLKSGKQPTFSSAYFKLCEEMTSEFQRHREVMTYLRLSGGLSMRSF